MRDITPYDIAHVISVLLDRTRTNDDGMIGARLSGEGVQIDLTPRVGEPIHFRAVVVEGDGPVVAVSPAFVAAAQALYRWRVSAHHLAGREYARAVYALQEAVEALTVEELTILGGDEEAAQAQTGGASDA